MSGFYRICEDAFEDADPWVSSGFDGRVWSDLFLGFHDGPPYVFSHLALKDARSGYLLPYPL